MTPGNILSNAQFLGGVVDIFAGRGSVMFVEFYRYFQAYLVMFFGSGDDGLVMFFGSGGDGDRTVVA